VLRELHVQLLQGGLGPAGKQNTKAMHEYPYPLSAIEFGLLETRVLVQTHWAVIPCSFAPKRRTALFAPPNRCGGCAPPIGCSDAHTVRPALGASQCAFARSSMPGVRGLHGSSAAQRTGFGCCIAVRTNGLAPRFSRVELLQYILYMCDGSHSNRVV
jgi:hypothetical protein